MRSDFPILENLSQYLETNNNFSGKKIAWHCHLTDLTALAANVLIKKGAQLILSECNPSTTSDMAVNYMRKIGANIYLGENSCHQSLLEKPIILADTGLALISKYLENPLNDFAFAGSEITTSGITKLRLLKEISLPVININQGQIKTHIENFHGVGDGLIDLLPIITEKNWANEKTSVIGYGKVGAGVAYYLRQIGAQVSVVEKDPIRALTAHYDGFQLSSLKEALLNSDLLVTATGSCSLISGNLWQDTKDGIIVVNVGHSNKELDLETLSQNAISISDISKHLQEFTLRTQENSVSKKIYIACKGNPANVVLLSGSPEPTLIHLTTELLCMNYLLELANNGNKKLPFGENALPIALEQVSSKLALFALGFQLN